MSEKLYGDVQLPAHNIVGAQIYGTIKYQSLDPLHTVAAHDAVKRVLNRSNEPDMAKPYAKDAIPLQTVVVFDDIGFRGDFVKSVSDMDVKELPDGRKVYSFTIEFN